MIRGDGKDGEEIGVNEFLPEGDEAWIILTGASGRAIEDGVEVVGVGDASGGAITSDVVGGIGEEDDDTLAAWIEANFRGTKGNLEEGFQLGFRSVIAAADDKIVVDGLEDG